LPGSTVVDIGANKGGYTYWLSKAVDRKGKVFAFEPQPHLADYLKKSFAEGFNGNITVESIGLSSKCGTARLIIPEKGKSYSPGATLEADNCEGFHSFNVPTDTLDNYFAGKNSRPVRFIKCDVEGHELEVFKGGETLLKEDHPVILFECESRHLSKNSIRDVFKYLLDLGYEGHFFFDKKLLPLSIFDEKVHHVWGAKLYANNFLFMIPEHSNMGVR